MIKATLEQNQEGGHIVVVGHAPRPPGAEKTGNLVCASASFLTCLTAETLADIAGVDVEKSTDNYESASGYLSFRWHGKNEKTDTIIKEWVYGMRWLSECYAGTIEILADCQP